ncbi:MAG TPA: thymidylate synthase [Terriglobales bacterium]|jgi:thymidylate synthase|nr:thymidylate synthase [Terriglobales bacterium]
MHITANTLDDLLRRVINKILKSGNATEPSRGKTNELIGVLLEITDPRARLSRTEGRSLLFGGLGELLWYLAGSKQLSFIRYYLPRYSEESDDGRTVHGAYGPRFFKMRGINQIQNVLDLLKNRPASRRAVIQLFDATDIEDIAHEHKNIPCTCTLQFMVRHGRLHMFTSMRSNDVFLGLPHDLFTFTMLQEIIARTLGVELGKYKHAVGSLHIYEKDRGKAEQFLKEGWQASVLMPSMPLEDPWKSIRKVLKAERAVRHNRGINIGRLGLEAYWEDIVRLLQIYSYAKKANADKIARLKKMMSSRIYDVYIEKKKQKATLQRVKRTKPIQEQLF